MPRVEVDVLQDRDDAIDAEGEVVLQIKLGQVALDVHLVEPKTGSPLLTVNERLAGGGVRRLVTERLGRPRPGPYVDHFTNTPEDAAAWERATEGGA